eukprot:GSMAST32.ASY1.ANO1.2017.1 assembled CDS
MNNSEGIVYTREGNVDSGRRPSFALRSSVDVQADFSSLCFPDSPSASLDSVGKFKSLYDATMNGTLCKGKIRSICWKVFLGYIPRDMPRSSWVVHLDQKREEYSRYKEKHMPDPTKIGMNNADLAMCNPLSLETESPWQKFYEGKELVEEINKDLGRLYPTGCGNYFESEPLRKMMLNILFVWCKIHEDTSYRQGMHEILAPIIYTLENQNKSTNNDNDNFCREEILTLIESILDSNNVEVDAFWLFDEIMKDLKPLFPTRDMSSHSSSTSKNSNSTTNYESFSPILGLCLRVQHKWLKEIDEELFKRLLKLGIEPQLYVFVLFFYQFRIYFFFQFHIEDVLSLWDKLFAMRSNGSSLDKSIELVSVAMLLHVRDFLLERDYAYALKRLMKYPPVEDVTKFTSQAQQM